jgi:hypothetical protein
VTTSNSRSHAAAPFSLPQRGRQVIEADLNRSESSRRRAGTKRGTSLRYRHLSNVKGQKSKSLILLARGGSG